MRHQILTIAGVGISQFYFFASRAGL